MGTFSDPLSSGAIGTAPINANVRPDSTDPQALQTSVFPYDAFEFDDPDVTAEPTLRLKAPWDFAARVLKSLGWPTTGFKIDFENGTFTFGPNGELIISDSETPVEGSKRILISSGTLKLQTMNALSQWLDRVVIDTSSPELSGQAKIGISPKGIFLYPSSASSVPTAAIAHTPSEDSVVLSPGHTTGVRTVGLPVTRVSAASATPTSCISSENIPYVAYIRTSDNYILWRTAQDSSWGTASVAVAAASNNPQLVAAANNRFWLAYRRNSDSYIVERYWDGSVWGAETVIVASATTGKFSYHYVSESQRVLVYRSGANALTTRYYASGWATDTSLAGTPYTSLNYPVSFVFRDGGIGLAFYGVRSGPTYQIAHYRWNGSAWVFSSSYASTSSVTDMVGVAPTLNSTINFYTTAAGTFGQMINDLVYPWNVGIITTPTLLKYRNDDVQVVDINNSTTYVETIWAYKHESLGAGIIESGSNANGSYLKYSDGAMIAWGAASLAPGTVNNQNIGTYGWSFYSSAATGVTFPTPFYAAPQIQASAQSGFAIHDTVTVNGFNLYAVGYSSGSRVLTWLAIGRWKA